MSSILGGPLQLTKRDGEDSPVSSLSYSNVHPFINVWESRRVMTGFRGSDNHRPQIKRAKSWDE